MFCGHFAASCASPWVPPSSATLALRAHTRAYRAQYTANLTIRTMSQHFFFASTRALFYAGVASSPAPALSPYLTGSCRTQAVLDRIRMLDPHPHVRGGMMQVACCFVRGARHALHYQRSAAKSLSVRAWPDSRFVAVVS